MLTKEDKLWIVRISMIALNMLIHTLGTSNQITAWRNNHSMLKREMEEEVV